MLYALDSELSPSKVIAEGEPIEGRVVRRLDTTAQPIEGNRVTLFASHVGSPDSIWLATLAPEGGAAEIPTLSSLALLLLTAGIAAVGLRALRG